MVRFAWLLGATMPLLLAAGNGVSSSIVDASAISTPALLTAGLIYYIRSERRRNGNNSAQTLTAINIKLDRIAEDIRDLLRNS